MSGFGVDVNGTRMMTIPHGWKRPQIERAMCVALAVWFIREGNAPPKLATVHPIRGEA